MNNDLIKTRTKDLTGQRFSRLLVKGFAGYRGSKNQSKWLCLCDCGNETEVFSYHLKSNHTTSCGCMQKERASFANSTHGLSGTKEYETWENIKQRCYDPNHKHFQHYGGRGIGMGESFRNDFMLFLQEVGDAPEGHRLSIDRVDNDLGYVKGNMQWATPAQQARNKGLRITNSTGVTGVQERWFDDGRGYFITSWYMVTDGVSKKLCKYFPIHSMGRDKAFNLACECRAEQIAKLNSEGYGYSAKHGK